MWLLTNFGFFSVVQKEGETLLTVRARDRQDLLNLKASCLPSLGEIEESAHSDYRFRARVPREVFADALRQIVLDIDYPNFKNSVAARQGKARARIYGEVWSKLMALQEGGRKA